MNILITGASRGIGLATAKQLDIPENKLFLVATSKESFKDTFQNAELFAADLANMAEVTRVAGEISEAAGHVDVLINNAGAMVLKKFEQMSESDIALVLNLDLHSHILLTHALLPALRKSDNPQIVFMSSMAAKSSLVGESVYSAAKGGVTNFANVLRNELGSEIRVSTVHAWGTNTWGAPEPNDLMEPADVATAMEFIITRPSTVMVESIDLGSPKGWRGGQAPWSPA